MEYINDMLEFKIIKEALKGYALTEKAKKRFEQIAPIMSEREVIEKTRETTEARTILDTIGTPPLTALSDIERIAEASQRGEMLSVDDLEAIRQYAASCMRLKKFLKRGEELELSLASYGRGMENLEPVKEEIERCIRNSKVDDCASKELKVIRKKVEKAENGIRVKLESILKSKKEYFSESFVSNRNGHYTLPVKKEYKLKVSGSVIDTSASGATYFIEPSSVSKLKGELEIMRVEESNEERKILYTLSVLISDFSKAILLNVDYIEELDYIFAKGKLSQELDAKAAVLNTERLICLKDARHPLLKKEQCVPLNMEIRNGIRGIVITGPNTGGKTVALKTVGLLSVMAQSGLHIPCGESSVCMNSRVLCDIGDNQSITENLSTFSSHIKNVVQIISDVDENTLVLMDELGSGTDPAEGMGIAVAILEELKESRCTFIATTHYPEVKGYAEKTEGLMNARMAFDKESLKPLYILEMGEAGESCAFYIAKQLGMPGKMLKRAYDATYGNGSINIMEDETPQVDRQSDEQLLDGAMELQKNSSTIKIEKQEPPKPVNSRALRFGVGDSVMVFPQKKLGIVFQPADAKGDVGVQIQKKKELVNHKRLQLKASAKDLYPEDYDFSIIFDSIEVRKARHSMNRKHQEGLEITY